MSEVNTKELLQAVKYCLPATTKDANVLASHAISIDDNKLYAFNDWLGITTPLAIPFTGNVEAQKLYKTLQSITQETVTVKDTETAMIIKAGKKKIELPKIVADLRNRTVRHFLPFKDATYFPLANMVDVLKEMRLKREIPELLGVYIDGCTILSTNNEEINYGQFEGNVDPIRLSNKIIGVLPSYDFTSMAVSGNFVSFISPAVTMIARQFDKISYPITKLNQWVDAFKAGEKLATIMLSDEVVKSITNLKTFSESDTQYILTVSKDTLILDAKSIDGTYTDEVSIEEFDYNTGSYQVSLLMVLEIVSKSIRELSFVKVGDTVVMVGYGIDRMFIKPIKA